MSHPILYTDAGLTGRTLYATVQQSATGPFWNGSAYEAYDAAHWASYVVTLAEQTAGAGDFAGDIPAGVPAGTVWVTVYRRLGAGEATTDPVVADGYVFVTALAGTDVMADAMAWLTDQLQANASAPVVYQRGAESVSLLATFGRKMFRIEDADGSRVEWTDKDFLIPAASLVLSGVAVLPERGDTVTVSQAGKVSTYEVLAPGGEPPWTWCDPYRKMVRIHGKLVSEVDA